MYTFSELLRIERCKTGHSHVFAAPQAGQKHEDKCAAVGTGTGLPKQVRPWLAYARR